MTALEKLIEHWRQLDTKQGPFIHRKDTRHVPQTGFAVGQLPYPYVGDLVNADVWVLMLNSGVGDNDHIHEAKPILKKRLIANLRQAFKNIDYPFHSLDPKFDWTGTSRYYYRDFSFRTLIACYAKASGLSESDAQHRVAQRCAILELVPYRSKNGNLVALGKIAKTLPSAELAKDVVHEALSNSDRLIVVPRSARYWGFKYDCIIPGRLVTYKFNQRRSGSVKPTCMGGRCAGGDAIIERLLRH